MRIAFIFFLSLYAGLVQAHKPSDSYLTIAVDQSHLGGRWDIAVRDLDYALGLDADADGTITWGEVRRQHAAIAAYAIARLQISTNAQACTAQVTRQLLDGHSDGTYVVLEFAGSCPARGALAVEYRLFFDLDPQHRGLARITQDGHTSNIIFDADHPRRSFGTASANRWRQFADYFTTGVWHIWQGFDHLLFLLALLLPTLLQRDREGTLRPAPLIKPVLWSLAKVVTAFTLAHSISLTLATLEWVALPSRWVESAIAASVVFAAVNNVVPMVRRRLWALAFAFGLIHGLGFAGVLLDLGLPVAARVLALIAFNVGVEAGQLAVVAGFFLLAYPARATRFYRWVIYAEGSVVIASLASIWFIERAFNLTLL